MNNFHYAMYLTNSLYGIKTTVEDFEEVGLIAFGLIGNKRYRLYRTTIDIDHGIGVLPCNCDVIEAVTYNFEDWNYVSNIFPEGDYSSLFTENYIEGRKALQNPLYSSGKYVKYERENDTLILRDHIVPKVYVLYWGLILDDEGLPEITDNEAYAIAVYCAYVAKFKEGLVTNNPSIIQMSSLLKQLWELKCDQARVPEQISLNEMDEILDAKTSWNRKVYKKSYKPL